MSFVISGTTSSSHVPLPPTLSVPQIFSYTSASSYPQTTNYVTVPSLPLPQDSTSTLNYIPMFTLPPTLPPGFPTVSQHNRSASSSSLMSQYFSFVSRLPRWSSYVPSNTSVMPITTYMTTPSGLHHYYSRVSWPYPHLVPYRSLHQLPSTESSTPFHHFLPHPSSVAVHYPSTTTSTSSHPVYNTNYHPTLQ